MQSQNPFYFNAPLSLDLSAISQVNHPNKTFHLDVSQIPPSNDHDQDDLWQIEFMTDHVDFLKKIPENSQEASSMEELVISEARKLKNHVIQVLEKYQRMLAIDQKQIKLMIPNDFAAIQSEFNYLENIYTKSNPSKEVNQIKILVQEFLTKFKPKYQKRMNNSSSMEESSVTFKDPEKLVQNLNQKILAGLQKLQQVFDEDSWSQIKPLLEHFLQSQIKKERFKELRQIQKEIQKMENEEVNKVMKNMVKSCFLKLKILENDEQEDKERKRRFFDLVLKVKFSLPREHPGQRVMISSLYDRVVSEGVGEENWQQFVVSQIEA